MDHSRAWESLTYPVKDLRNYFTRVDLAVNDFGAQYGAERAAKMRLSNSNIDSRISILIDTSPALAPLSKDDAANLYRNKLGYYKYWKKIFVPDAGYEN